MQPKSVFDEIMSPADAAQCIGYSASHVRNLATWGKIEARKYGRLWLIYVPSLRDYRQKRN